MTSSEASGGSSTSIIAVRHAIPGLLLPPTGTLTGYVGGAHLLVPWVRGSGRVLGSDR